MTDWRNRIIEVKQISAADLRGNSRNWRTHPDAQQKAIRGLLGEVGIVAPLVAYHSQRANGALTLIDGHMRQETGGTWPCVVLDVTDAEADLVLATFDPISALAETDTAILDALLRDVNTGEQALQELLAEMAEDAGLYDGETPKPWQPEEIYSDPNGDGVDIEAGYRLCSIWYGMTKNNEVRKYMLDLPKRPDAHNGATVKMGYSRTNAEETERIVKTYMRPGDRFFELCCGWMTFSSTAKYFGFSGRGGDIWDVSLDFCRRQLDAMPGAGEVDVVRADCRDTQEPDAAYDFVHSNPPFFSLEPYGETADDLASSGSYDLWLDAMADMGKEAERILKPGGLANFVINDFRERGAIVPMHAHFTEAIGRKSSLFLHDFVVAEVISQALRFRKHDYERRRTVKCHEYVITFKKPGGTSGGAN